MLLLLLYALPILIAISVPDILIKSLLLLFELFMIACAEKWIFAPYFKLRKELKKEDLNDIKKQIEEKEIEKSKKLDEIKNNNFEVEKSKLEKEKQEIIDKINLLLIELSEEKGIRNILMKKAIESINIYQLIDSIYLDDDQVDKNIKGTQKIKKLEQ